MREKEKIIPGHCGRNRRTFRDIVGKIEEHSGTTRLHSEDEKKKEKKVHITLMIKSARKYFRNMRENRTKN